MMSRSGIYTVIRFDTLVSILVATAVVGCGGSDGDGLDPAAVEAPIIWPITASTEPSRLSSTFGPRIQVSTDDYDFHRGIDIPVPVGTRVYAAADGEVVIAGEDDRYPDLIIQLAHCNDAEPPPSQDECQASFYTNYQHLQSVSVKPGARVRKGQVIGRSGAPSSGFPHLHFELRQGSSWQRAAVHPLGILPYADMGPPSATIDSINLTDPSAPIVTLIVERPAAELDVLRVEVELVAIDGSVISSQNYDVNEWNYEYTELNDSTGNLDNPGFNGITVMPELFDQYTDTQTIKYRFRRLTNDRAASEVTVVARVVDVLGQSSETTCSLQGC